jgi:hypothetical protein
VNQLFNLSPVKTLFDRIAMPISIWQKTIDEPGHGQSLNVADEILRKFAKELAQKRGIEGAGKNAILRTGSSSSSAPNRQGSSRQGAVLAEATLTSKFLLYLAFVNMNEGVGRGW